jgi:hypothetical protein
VLVLMAHLFVQDVKAFLVRGHILVPKFVDIVPTKIKILVIMQNHYYVVYVE